MRYGPFHSRCLRYRLPSLISLGYLLLSRLDPNRLKWLLIYPECQSTAAQDKVRFPPLYWCIVQIFERRYRFRTVASLYVTILANSTSSDWAWRALRSFVPWFLCGQLLRVLPQSLSSVIFTPVFTTDKTDHIVWIPWELMEQDSLPLSCVSS